MSNLSLYLGGAKSGKTRLAMEHACQYPPKRLYLATAQAWDKSMDERIKNHQAERGSDWLTIEEPLNLIDRLNKVKTDKANVILIDCLTLWVNNLMCAQEPWPSLDEFKVLASNLAQAALNCSLPVIMVSNEVSGGIIPDNAMARHFKDATGILHQHLAQKSSEVYLVTASLKQKLK